MSEAATLLRMIAGHSQVASLEMLDLLPEAALILDSAGRLVRLNQSAASLMGHVIKLRDRSFQLDDEASKDKLHTLIRSMLDNRIEPEVKLREVEIIDNVGVRLQVRGIFLSKATRSIFDTAAVLLLVNKAKKSVGSILADRYKLTPDEIDVANRLFLGEPVEKIAGARKSNNDTVRMQLKSIFLKTKTTGQANFVSFIAGLS